LNCIVLHTTTWPAPKPVAKIDLLRAAADWPRALSIAAKFPSLGQHRIAIARAHNAIQSPAFYRAIGQDPAALVQAGIQALQERYKL
jgi:hypothetical protein